MSEREEHGNYYSTLLTLWMREFEKKRSFTKWKAKVLW
jgi:hypothetical protein